MATPQKSYIKKEVVLCDCLVNDGWKEITFNCSGTPSIQDIKIPSRTGGINITNHSNRFIFWKTRGNILELVEHSLDVNVVGNQLRYKFEDSPVLGDSVSLYETKQNIVLLVATISSVHKISFPRPKVISTHHEHVNSIFSDASGAAESINNPACFHIINAASTLPYTGASFLTPDYEALFSLALQNGSVAIVKINPTGEKHAKSFDVKSDSFFGSLNFFSSKSRPSQESSILGMVFKCIRKSLFLVTLSFDGHLKCYNADMLLVSAVDALTYCRTRNLGTPGSQSHLIRKSSDVTDPSLWIFFCLEGDSSVFIQFSISTRGEVEFQKQKRNLPNLMPSQMDQLIDFLVLPNVVWCMWHTMANESVVTGFDIGSDDTTWRYAELEPLKISATSPAMCPQGKISDLIFKPGLFSKSDIAKALEVNIGSFQHLEPHLSLRQKVLQVIEREIDAKASELPDEMDEMARATSEHIISEQIWEDFYSACVQYRKRSLPPLGMHFIASANLLLVIKKSSFSFLRPLADLETLYQNPGAISILESPAKTVASPRKESYRGFNKFVTSLSNLQLNSNINQEIAAALIDVKRRSNEDFSFLSGSKQFRELLNDFAHKKITELFVDSAQLTLLQEMREQELTSYIEQYLALLNREPADDLVPASQFYRSVLGVNLLTMSLNQIAELRLRLTCTLVTMLRTRDHKLMSLYYEALWSVIRDAWILTWLHNNVDSRTQDSVLLTYVASSDLRHVDLMESVHLLIRQNNSCIVQFLSTEEYAVYLQDISKILDYSEWKFELMRAYLSTGNDKQAFAIVKVFSKQANLEFFIQAIDIFSKFLSCEYVIDIVNVALERLDSQNNNNSVLYSILFENYLRIKDYGQAFETILRNKDRNKANINLHVLILNMLEAQECELLLELLLRENTSNIIPEVMDLCHKRMYTFPIEQAQVYFEFLVAYHVTNAYYTEAAQVKFNQAFCYVKDLNRRCECLAVAVTLMKLIDEPSRRYVQRKKDVDTLKFKIYKGEKIYTELAFEQLNISQVKNIYELEKAKAYVKDCSLDASLQEVVSLLTHNGLYKKAVQLAMLWNEDVRPIFVSLTSRCIQDEISDWDWIFLNDIDHIVNSGKMDIGALMWALLEALLEMVELPGHKYVLRAICEKIISQGYDLPQFLKHKYLAICPGEVVQLLHKYGALKAATDLSCEILTTLTYSKGRISGMKAEEPKFSFTQLTEKSEQVYCGLQHIKFLQDELSRHEDDESLQAEFDRLKETLCSFENHAALVTTEKFRLLAV